MTPCSDRTLAAVAVAGLVWLAAPSAARAQDASVAGTVTDATGLALPGVTVEARSAEAGGPIEGAVTDGIGAFAIAGLPPGSYDVSRADQN